MLAHLPLFLTTSGSLLLEGRYFKGRLLFPDSFDRNGELHCLQLSRSTLLYLRRSLKRFFSWSSCFIKPKVSKEPILVFEDSKKPVENPTISARSKHLEILYHIRMQCAEEFVKLRHVSSYSMRIFAQNPWLQVRIRTIGII